MSAQDLLPRVELWQLSDGARQALADLVKEALGKALEEQGLRKQKVRAGALRAADAAAYLGVGRTRFYVLLKEDPELMALSFTAGRARMWLRDALDRWMQARTARQEQEKLKKTA